ncbi:M15 family metallopeptidase [Nakamurella aerolata]|uniref:M15 family metallopeptidase n=1 Tax=Nakamurella aerolata TaxID=1656892 RepID=A0A849A7A1_9ACTN|nr:M15 family metallopeptidase [Nakamurella aerolata]NNG36365.1 M15 family metallopeptidase [Nakamurella aerolata]
MPGRLLATALAVALAATGVLAPPSTPSPASVPESAARPAEPAVRTYFKARVLRVDPATAASMIGVSWKAGCPVPIDKLRIIEMNYWGFDGKPHDGGRLMVNSSIAADTVRAFTAMFNHRFPIRRMELIEKYGGSDDASMAADNTSAFNCRPITGQQGNFSIHSYGEAIDINTIENPYVKGTTVLPTAGKQFTDRTDVRPGMIVAGDDVVRTFTGLGFRWGGSWTSPKDYQHMEIPRR